MLIRPLLLLTLLLSPTVYAKLNATPLNSPVREAFLKVKLAGESSISEVYFKPKQGGEEVKGEVEKEGTTFIGKFRTSFLKPGMYEYRVKIRSTSGKSQNNESASVAFINFEIDKSLVVADPGPEGEKALLGIDRNTNNLRDDVERWIAEQINLTNNQKNALRQYAKAKQLEMSVVDDKEAAMNFGKQSLDGQFCLHYTLNNDYIKTSKLKKLLKVEIYNTRDRLMAEDKANRHFHGATRGTYDPLAKPHKEKCSFKFE